MKAIYNASDEFEAQMICNSLSDAGINSYSADSSSGEYLKISSGFSVYGKDIYVNDEDEIRAKNIIHSIIKDNGKNNSSEDIKIPWYRNRKILTRIIIAYMIIMVIVLLILTNLH